MQVLDHAQRRQAQALLLQHQREEEVYLNLVLEFFPETVYRDLEALQKSEARGCRASREAVHVPDGQGAREHPLGRRVPPRHQAPEPAKNTLTHELKLCDFGSAKILVEGEPNDVKVCSMALPSPRAHLRRHRLHHSDRHMEPRVRHGGADAGPTPLSRGSPGSTSWWRSSRCSARQPSGDPRHEPKLHRVQVPANQSPSWSKVFHKRLSPDAGSHLAPARVLARGEVHRPSRRLPPGADELRDPGTRLPNGRALPPSSTEDDRHARHHAQRWSRSRCPRTREEEEEEEAPGPRADEGGGGGRGAGAGGGGGGTGGGGR